MQPNATKKNFHDAVKNGRTRFYGNESRGKYGGAGLDTISYVLAVEEISKVDASAGVIMSLQIRLCAMVWKNGKRRAKTKISSAAQGKNLVRCSFGRKGSDATNQMTAVREGVIIF